MFPMFYICRDGRFGRGAILYHHSSQLFKRLLVDSHYRPGSFLRFNSRPIMSSLYCATWNKGYGFCLSWHLWFICICNLVYFADWHCCTLKMLVNNNNNKLWSIVETSVMSANYGITVKQTTYTVQLWRHGLGMPCGSRLSRRTCKSSSRISGAGSYDTITMGPIEEYNTRRGLNKYTSYIKFPGWELKLRPYSVYTYPYRVSMYTFF